MTKAFKLFLVCLLSISVLSFKNRLRQGPGEIAPPGASPSNQTGNQTQLPPEANATQIPAAEGNVTQPGAVAPQEGPQANITETPQGNETQPQPEQPQFPQAMEGNETQPQLPEGEIKNISESARTQPEQAVGGAAGMPPVLPSVPILPSTTVVNVDTPVISVSGEAIGSLTPDLIKIGVLVENPGTKAGEALQQSQQRLNDLNSKLKELGLKDENIFILGSLVNLQKKLKQSVADTQANQTENGQRNQTNNQLFAASQIEIQVNDIAQAGKVIDLLNSQNFEIKYIDYNYKPSTLEYLIKYLTANALSDAETRARNAIENTGNQLGKMLNLNVEVDKDYQNYINYQEGTGLANPQGVKVMKVTVAVTFALQPGQAGGAQPQPGQEQPPLEQGKKRPLAAEIGVQRPGNVTQPAEAGNVTQPQAAPVGNATLPGPAGNRTGP